MPCGMDRGVNVNELGRTVRPAGWRCHRRSSLSEAVCFRPRNPVVKSPSSVGGYKSGFDSRIL